MIHGGQQEEAESAFGGVRLRHGLALQKPGEKSLREVLRIGWRIPAPAHVSIKWIPISSAQVLQGDAGGGRVASSRREHDAPMGGRKIILRFRCCARMV